MEYRLKPWAYSFLEWGEAPHILSHNSLLSALIISAVILRRILIVF